jgi:propanol-preferring alcohol dehydrogenase
MKAAQLLDRGVFEVRDVPDPTLTAGHVLLKVEGAGMCRSDLHLVHDSSDALPLPLTLGHETTGRVIDPNGAPGLEVGQSVLVAGIWGCMACSPCRQGRVNACETWAVLAPMPLGPGLGMPGGMAEYMVAPSTGLFDLGDMDTVAAAPLADAGVTPAHAISLTRDLLVPGATAVVVGLGGLGHLGLQILRETTAVRIIAVDVDPARAADAAQYGADVRLVSGPETAEEVLDLTKGVGADVILDFVGMDETLKLSIATVRSYGAIVTVGLGGGTLPFMAGGESRVDSPPWGVRVVRPYGATHSDVTQVIALAQAGKISAKIETHPLVDAPLVLERLRRGDVDGRAVLIP